MRESTNKRATKISLNTCTHCGDTLGAGGYCSCEKMTLHSPLHHGEFLQPFVHLVRQFLDLPSHAALLATCRYFRELYQNPSELLRTNTHFAFSPFQMKYLPEIGLHANPLLYNFKQYLIKLQDGNAYLYQQKKGSNVCTLIDSKINGGFKKMLLPDELKGKLAKLLYLGTVKLPSSSHNYIAVTTDHQIFYGNYAQNEPPDFNSIEQISLMTECKIKAVFSGYGDEVIIVTTEEKNNVLKLKLANPIVLTQMTFDQPIADVLFLDPDYTPKKHGYLFLTTEGNVWALGKMPRRYHPEKKHETYDEPTSIPIQASEKIIGMARGEKFLVFYSQRNIFCVGNTQKDSYPVDNKRVDYTQIMMPEIEGEIIQVKAGDHHVLVLTNQGEVYSAGYNYANQLGRNKGGGFFGYSYDKHCQPVEGLPPTIVSIATTENQSAFFSSTGQTFLSGTLRSAPYPIPGTSGSVLGIHNIW